MNIRKSFILLIIILSFFQLNFAAEDFLVIKDVDCSANTFTLSFYDEEDHDFMATNYTYEDIAANSSLSFIGFDGIFRIYSGPFDINDTLILEKTFSNENSVTIDMGTQKVFKVFFNPIENYSTIDEVYLIDDCSPENLAKLIPPTYNVSYDFDNVGVNANLVDANQEEIGDLAVYNVFPGDFGVPELDDNIKAFMVSSNEVNFSSMTLTVYVLFDPKNDIEVYSYFKGGSQWNQISNFSKGNNQIILNGINLGIYGIVEKTVEPVVEESNNTVVEESNNTVVEEENNDIINSKTSSFLIPSILLFSILIIGIFVFISMNKHSHKKAVVDNTREPEILDSYKQAYKKTKDYVLKYKKDFSKDQIYRALKGVNIPDDVIDKVFLEEY